ncbi:hypothetical protein [Desulfofustis glycolicus]|nr:hypothetical protein [Desulfofustis glycolicus]
MEGLSAGLGGQSTKPQRSSRRQERTALPTMTPIFNDHFVAEAEC